MQPTLFDLPEPTAKPRKPRRKVNPAQLDMFAGLAPEFGVNEHPLISITDKTRLVLVSEDPRTAEQRAADSRRAETLLNLRLIK
jgi:hypothetical protein